MKKLFKFLFISFLLIFIFSINELNTLAIVPDARLIVTNPGENMSSEVNVSWHTEVEGTFVIYTVASDPTYASKKTIVGECSPTPFSSMPNVKQCKATLSNLEANTKYIYKVGNAIMSEEYSFVTAGADSFSFLHLTDIHSYLKIPTRVQIANSLINKAKTISPNLGFVLFSGDVTAYGAWYEEWDSLYQMDGTKNLMYAITPGNHDYYNNVDGVLSTTHVGYFNSMMNNPINGATGVKGSSYYFKYGNALFISIDSEAAYQNQTVYLPNQKAWLKEVVQNNPSDFIIAFCHKPFYTGNGSSTKFIKSNFQPLFDELGVDLVLTGDNHILARTYKMYNDSVTQYERTGTVYLTGPQLGDRAVEAGTVPSYIDFTTGGKVDGGTIITISNDKIDLNTISLADPYYPTINRYSIYSKSTLITRDDYLSSLSIESDPLDFSKATLKYTNPGIGTINKIKVYHEGNLLEQFYFPTTHSVNLTTIPTDIGRFDLRVETTFRSGEVVDRYLTLLNNDIYFGSINNLRIEEDTNLDPILKWDSALVEGKLDRFEVYVNGSLYKNVSLLDTSLKFEQLSSYHKNDIIFKAIDKDGKTLYEENLTYGTEASSVNIAFENTTLNLEVGSKVKPNVLVTPSESVDFEFTSSNPEVATVDANGEITAVGKGTCTISVNIERRWDVKASVEITVTEKEAVTEKGCGKQSAILGLGLLGIAFIFKRRRFF